ncbi:hypothetical protein CDN97_22890 [Pantoea sp. AMG 501]|nr:hypothetical protein CDN97_22890 [Pantoea sp. AMG 501]
MLPARIYEASPFLAGCRQFPPTGDYAVSASLQIGIELSMQGGGDKALTAVKSVWHLKFSSPEIFVPAGQMRSS